MQNENAGKTIATLAAEKYPINADMMGTISEDVAEYERRAWQDGYTTAQQSQPMWREILPQIYYDSHLCKNGADVFIKTGKGSTLLSDGYTHYLSSEDLLKLPTLTKTTPQERG